MGKAVVGVFDTFGEAQSVVRELEIEGIAGEAVEVISDPDHDVRGLDLGVAAEEEKHRNRISERIANFLQSLHRSEQHKDDAYVRDHEFYQQEIRGGKTVVIVRQENDDGVQFVSDVMRFHHARGIQGHKRPSAVVVKKQPETPGTAAPAGTVTSTIGTRGTTTGNYADDLEGRGKQMWNVNRAQDAQTEDRRVQVFSVEGTSNRIKRPSN